MSHGKPEGVLSGARVSGEHISRRRLSSNKVRFEK